jgi:hypothetical protein
MQLTTNEDLTVLSFIGAGIVLAATAAALGSVWLFPHMWSWITVGK